MKGLKLHTNGMIEEYQLPEADQNYIRLQRAIDCDCIDIVHAKNLKEPYCLVVDDEGLLKEEPEMNLVASYLYGALDHGQPLCGDAIIMKDRFTDDGIDTVGLDDEDLEYLREYFADPKTYESVVRTAYKLASLLEG